MPLILLPSFFTMAISNALLPVVSNSYSHKNYNYTKYKIKQAITISLVIGVPCTLLFMSIPDYFLNLIYKTILIIEPTNVPNIASFANPIACILAVRGP